MSDPNTLGSIVRRRRLESGYSLGQLASKVGKTAAEVRAWERDAELPEHGILDRLAETLELDVAEIRAKVTTAQEAAEAEKDVDVEVVEEQPDDSAADKGKLDTDEDEEASEEKDDEASEEEVDEASEEIVVDPDVSMEFSEKDAAPPEDEAETTGETESDDDLPGFAVEDPFTPPEDPTASEAAASLIDAPTEAVPVPIITETAKAARAQRAAAVLEEPPLPMVEPAPDADPGLLRYLEPLRLLFDPQSRYLYWIRAGLTVIVMLILVVFLFRMLGSLLDAVGELLDTIEPAATDPDDLDALGSVLRSG